MESEVIESTTLELRARSDEELLRRLAELVSRSRRVEAELVAHIGEVDQRRLFARFAFPSMFAYCTEALHLSEAEAYRRITVARAARQHPVLLEMLGDGRLHLSGLAVLVPLLTAENRDTLLKRATHRSKRQIEALVAALSPRPDARSAIRELPQREQAAGPATGASALARADDRRLPDGGELVPGRVEGTLDERLAGAAARGLTPRSTAKPAVEPLSPGRYKVQFTASAELRDKIERLTALMRSEVPDGDLGTIVERAITEKIARAGGTTFRHDHGSAEVAGQHRRHAHVAPSTCSRTPRRVRAQRRAVRFRGRAGPPLLGTAPTGVPSPASVRHGRRPRS